VTAALLWASLAAPVALLACCLAAPKGALFLAVGVAGATGSRRLPLLLVPVAVLARGLGGLPPTGGALAKLAIKEPLGAGLPALLATVSAATTTLLVAHWLRCLAASRAEAAEALAPVIAGLLLAWGLARLRHRLPAVPEGDLVAPAERGARALARWRPALPAVPAGAAQGGRAAAAALRRIERPLRDWPAAALALLLVAAAIAVALGAAR
jgi:multicomponent Na+:H+ antiporter subunit A